MKNSKTPLKKDLIEEATKLGLKVTTRMTVSTLQSIIAQEQERLEGEKPSNNADNTANSDNNADNNNNVGDNAADNGDNNGDNNADNNKPTEKKQSPINRDFLAQAAQLGLNLPEETELSTLISMILSERKRLGLDNPKLIKPKSSYNDNNANNSEKTLGDVIKEAITSNDSVIAKAKKTLDELIAAGSDTKAQKTFIKDAQADGHLLDVLNNLYQIRGITTDKLFKKATKAHRLGQYVGFSFSEAFALLTIEKGEDYTLERSEMLTALGIINDVLNALTHSNILETIAEVIPAQIVDVNTSCVEYSEVRKVMRPFVKENQSMFTDKEINLYVNNADVKAFCHEMHVTTKKYEASVANFPKFADCFQRMMVAKLKGLDLKIAERIREEARASIENSDNTDNSQQTLAEAKGA